MTETERRFGQSQPGPPPPADPGPEGGEGERVGEDDDEAVTVPNPNVPDVPKRPATPDANPIDPRVLTREGPKE